MTKTLVAKELRESLPLTIVAALAIGYALMQHTGWSVVDGDVNAIFASQGDVPFALDGFEHAVVLIGGAFAAALGLKQAAWEDHQGMFRYLLYRPVSRRRVMLAKMAVGVALVLAVAGVLILAYALWAATPGKHASPFSWEMTLASWQVWAVLPIVHLTAMMSGLRPAKWYGTRLAPLVAGIGAAVLIGAQPFWQLAAIASPLVCAVFVTLILHVGDSRDY
jgi:hypothetical protein